MSRLETAQNVSEGCCWATGDALRSCILEHTYLILLLIPNMYEVLLRRLLNIKIC